MTTRAKGGRLIGSSRTSLPHAWHAAGRTISRALEGRFLRPVRYLTGPPQGRRLVGRVRAFEVPGLERQVAEEGRPFFRVPLACVTGPLGFSFHPDGWNPYVAALRDGTGSSSDSPLHHYYARFTPRSVQEALLDDHPGELRPLHTWPVRQRLLSVWALTRDAVDRALVQTRGPVTGPIQFVGPHPPDHITTDVIRLRNVRDSIADHGYRPREFAAKTINGYFLVRDDQFRFVCRHGHHRLAALAELGYDHVEVTVSPKVVPVVHSDDLAWWTLERGGIYPAEVAATLFNKLFTENGRGKVAAWGLG